MVGFFSSVASNGRQLAAAATETAEKLSPTMRAAVLMALLGIALVGLLLVAVVLLGGSWVRRQGKHRRASAVPPDRAPLLRNMDRGHPLADGRAAGEKAEDP